MGIFQKLMKVFTDLFVMTWDLWLAALNILLPKHKAGRVVPSGVPGHNGKWPKYIAPGEGDSRSACPMLNAMVRPSAMPPQMDVSHNHPTGKPRHPPSFRPQHLLPHSQNHHPPNLQLRTNLLLLRPQLRRKLPQPLLLDRHLRPRRPQQAQRNRTRRQLDTPGLRARVRPGQARSRPRARTAGKRDGTRSAWREAFDKAGFEQGAEQEEERGEGGEYTVLGEFVPQHVWQRELFDDVDDFRRESR